MRQVTKLTKKPRPLVGIRIKVRKHRHPPIDAFTLARPERRGLQQTVSAIWQSSPSAFNPAPLKESGWTVTRDLGLAKLSLRSIAVDRSRLSKVTSALGTKRTFRRSPNMSGIRDERT